MTVQSVNEADKRRAQFKAFHPEINEIQSVHQLKDQKLIFWDGTLFEYYTPFGLKQTALIMACLASDQYNQKAWFKIITSGVVLVDQVRRWLKFDPTISKNQFPVEGMLRFKESKINKVPLWILENE